MAIITGKIVHDDHADFQGAHLDTTRPYGGLLSLSPKEVQVYPFFGVYTSPVLNLRSQEAISLGSVGISRMPWFIEPDKTMGLWMTKEGTGAVIRSDISSDLNAVIDRTDAWISGGISKHYLSSCAVTTPYSEKLSPASGFSLELSLHPNSPWSQSPFFNSGQTYVLWASAYLESASGTAMKLDLHTLRKTTGAVVPPYVYDHFRITTTAYHDDGTTSTYTVTYYANQWSVLGVTWNGASLETTMSDGIEIKKNSVSAPKPLLGQGLPFRLRWVSTQTSFDGMIFSNYAKTSDQIVDAAKRAFLGSSGVFLQTRTAASSGTFKDDWKGRVGDGDLLISKMDDLSFLKDHDLTDTAGGTAISSSGSIDPASKAFDGNFASPSYWTTGTLGSTVKDREWIGWDFGEGNEQTVSSVFFYQVSGNTMVNLVRVDKSADGVTWEPLVESAAKENYNRIILPAPETARFFRIFARAGAAGASSSWRIYEAGFCHPPVVKTSPLGAALAVSAMTEGEDRFSRAQGTEASNGHYLPISVRTLGPIAVQDFVKLSLRCNNPDAMFQLRFHSAASASAPSLTAAATWNYAFRVGSSDWTELFFPDLLRAALAEPSDKFYWFTLEVLDAAGGFTLDMKDMRFGVGLRSGDQIQSPFGPFVQYRAIFLTTV